MCLRPVSGGGERLGEGDLWMEPDSALELVMTSWHESEDRTVVEAKVTVFLRGTPEEKSVFLEEHERTQMLHSQRNTQTRM